MLLFHTSITQSEIKGNNGCVVLSRESSLNRFFLPFATLYFKVVVASILLVVNQNSRPQLQRFHLRHEGLYLEVTLWGILQAVKEDVMV